MVSFPHEQTQCLFLMLAAILAAEAQRVYVASCCVYDDVDVLAFLVCYSLR